MFEYMAIENPFVFGKAAEGTYFTDRTEDTKCLHANLTHGINTILNKPLRFVKQRKISPHTFSTWHG